MQCRHADLTVISALSDPKQKSQLRDSVSEIVTYETC